MSGKLEDYTPKTKPAPKSANKVDVLRGQSGSARQKTNAPATRPQRFKSTFAQLWSRRMRLLVGVGTTVAALLVGFFLFPVLGPMFGLTSQPNGSNATVDQILTGKVALTADELKKQIASHKLVSYWIGPRPGYKYALNMTTDGQVFVRYLPDGLGVEQPDSKFLVVGTYPQKGAFAIIAAAGGQQNAVTFVNSDGAQVYYNKQLSDNVYLAFPNDDHEVEIYSPVAGDAVLYSTTPGLVTLIQ